MESQNADDETQKNDAAEVVEGASSPDISNTQPPAPLATSPKATEPVVPLHEHALRWRETSQGKFVLWVVGGIAVLLGLAFACLAVPWTSYFSSIAVPSNTPMALQPTKSNESLIIVAEFENRTQSPIAPSFRIVEAIRQKIASSKLAGKVRVTEAKIPIQPNQFMSAEIAKNFGAVHSATLVIWGVQDGSGATAHLEYVRDASPLTHSDVTYTLTADITVDTIPSLADPGRLEASIVVTLPQQMSYLVMLTLGVERYLSNEPSEAIPYFESALQSTREIADLRKAAHEPYFYLGAIAQIQNRLDDAIAAYDETLRIDPKSSSAYNNRGTVYRRKGGLDNLDKAIADFTVAITIDSEFVYAYYNRGFAYIDKGGSDNLDKAINDFTAAIKLKPTNADSYYNRGLAYNKKGGIDDLDKAITDFTAAIAINSEYADAYYSRGNAYVNKGGADNLDKAITDFTAAIKLKPEDDNSYVNRGSAYIIKGGADNLDKAITDFTAAIKLKPEASAYNSRGVAYKDKGGIDNLDKAITDFTTAIAINSEYASAYYNRGNVYGGKGNLDKAITDFTTVIKLKPEDADAYSQRGMAYRLKDGTDNLDKSITDFTTVIKLKPEDADAYLSRGITYVRKGGTDNLDKAIADFTTVIKLKPEDADAYRNRGSAYKNKGGTENLDSAINDFDAAINLNKTYANAYCGRGDVFAARTNKPDAHTAFEQCFELATDDNLRQYAQSELDKLK